MVTTSKRPVPPVRSRTNLSHARYADGSAVHTISVSVTRSTLASSVASISSVWSRRAAKAGASAKANLKRMGARSIGNTVWSFGSAARACCFAPFIGSTLKWISRRARSITPGGYGRFVSGFTHFSTRTVTASRKMFSRVTLRSLSETWSSPWLRMISHTADSSFVPNALSTSSSFAKTPLETFVYTRVVWRTLSRSRSNPSRQATTVFL